MLEGELNIGATSPFLLFIDLNLPSEEKETHRHLFSEW